MNTDYVNQDSKISTFKHRFQNNTLLRGALLLTLANAFTRIIGFIYQIYLVRQLGAEGIGVFQLMAPLVMIVISLIATGLPVAVARYAPLYGEDGKSVLRSGSKLALLVSLPVSVGILAFAGPVAALIGDMRIAGPLRLYSLLPPFIALNAVTKNWHLGRGRVMPSVIGELTEQLIRVGTILTLLPILITAQTDYSKTSGLIVLCSLIGEAMGLLSVYISGFFYKKKTTPSTMSASMRRPEEVSQQLIKTAVPITLTRLLAGSLSSVNALLIPKLLVVAGLTMAAATSEYGLLIGMAMPLAFIPSTVSMALTRVLMPRVSKLQDDGNYKEISRNLSSSYRFVVPFCCFFTALFLTLSTPICSLVYHQTRAGEILSIFCLTILPMNIDRILGSTMNGLGMQNRNAVFSTLGGIIQMLLTILLVPKIGVNAYTVSILAAVSIELSLRIYSVKYRGIFLGLKRPLLASVLLTAFITFFNSSIFKMLPFGEGINVLVILVLNAFAFGICILLLQKSK